MKNGAKKEGNGGEMEKVENNRSENGMVRRLGGIVGER